MEILKSLPRSIKREQQRSIFRQSLFAFFKGVFCRTKTPNLASARTSAPLCKFYQHDFPKIKRAVIKDPRNHLKTTIEMAYILWLAIQRPHEVFDSEEEYARAIKHFNANNHLYGTDGSYLFTSASEKNAMACSAYMKSFPQNDPYFRYLFPELCPEYCSVLGEELIWNKEKWILPGRVEHHPQGYVEAAGTGTRLAMRHFKGIFLDDPVNENTWKTVTEIERNYEWIQLSNNLLETSSIDHPYASFELITGNLWSDNDVVSRVEANMPEFYIWHRSCWVCSNCGRANCIRSDSCSFTDEPLWPERYTKQGLEALRRNQGPLIFGAQYENEPVNKDTIRFSTDNCKWFTYDINRKMIIELTSEAGGIARLIPISSLDGYISLDPASSTDPRSCRSAIGVTCEDPSTGMVYFLDLWAEQARPKVVIDTLIDKYEFWMNQGLNIKHVGFESVGGQAYILPAITMEASLRNISLLTVEPKQETDIIYLYKTDRGEHKDERISNLLGWRVDAKLLAINKGLPYLQLFIYEFNRFPAAKSNDTLDQLAYAEQMYRRQALDGIETSRLRTNILNSRASGTGRLW